MRIQLLSDLHLETEAFVPEPAAQAELLVLAGDIDSTWAGFETFRHWPVPVVLIAGNHEFDEREITQAWPALRALCEDIGITLLECESLVVSDAQGRRIRLLGTTRWCDFNVFGEAQRERATRAAGYYVRVMRATLNGQPFDADAVREEALACRAWLASALSERAGPTEPTRPGGPSQPNQPNLPIPTSKPLVPRSTAELTPRSGDWDATVVVTHFAPSLKSADPRYGHQPGTASFCNADDELLPFADLWIHGHLHCRHDYVVEHRYGRTRVVCNARGHARRGEARGYSAERVLEV